jgi:carotenoid 1,2-hydratase
LLENGHPDAWHDVRTPGGYEWWYFDAESDDGRTRLVAIFLDGFVFHAGYLRRSKTATPDLFPCVYFAVYRDGRVAHQFMAQYPPGGLVAATDQPDVTAGPNTMKLEDDGSYRLKLSAVPWILTPRGPRFLDDRMLEGELRFQPVAPDSLPTRPFLSKKMTGATHAWHLAAPLCRVAGRITCGDDAIDFTGRGYHDHNYGDAPLGPGLRRWIWGRILTDDRCVGFHVAEPRDRRLPSEVHQFEADATGVREIEPGDLAIDWAGRSSWLLSYPKHVELGEVQLRNPHVVDSSPFYLRVAYDAGGGRQAFCEVGHPHRLRWPVLGRMIEMSIDKRTAAVDKRPAEV